jgi:hypothetical protein
MSHLLQPSPKRTSIRYLRTDCSMFFCKNAFYQHRCRTCCSHRQRESRVPGPDTSALYLEPEAGLARSHARPHIPHRFVPLYLDHRSPAPQYLDHRSRTSVPGPQVPYLSTWTTGPPYLSTWTTGPVPQYLDHRSCTSVPGPQVPCLIVPGPHFL